MKERQGQVFPPGTERLKRLRILEDRMSGCTMCRELVESRTRVVHWRGSPVAPLAIIGDAPGAEEDLQGMPFMGPSGRKLDEVLMLAGLSPSEDVFITNAVMCRTPNGRAPTSEEVGFCATRLAVQLAIVSPKALLILGGIAIAYGVQPRPRGESNKLEVRIGRQRPVSYAAITTYHPKFLLRRDSSSVQSEMVHDVRAAWKVAHE